MQYSFLAISIIVILLIVLIYYYQKMDSMESGCECGKENCACKEPPTEKENAQKVIQRISIPTTRDPQESASWVDVITQTELDPSIQESQNEFVKDVKRFSSGAGFTSVNDDLTYMSTNFQGLRRPEYVPIGPGARQVPDEDVYVLQRNKNFRW